MPEGTWDITVREVPSYCELRQKSGGVTSVAGHRVDVLERGRSRLTLSMGIRGLLAPIIGMFYKSLVTRYMSIEAQGIKLAAESTET